MVDKTIPFRLRLLKKLIPVSMLQIIPPQNFSKTRYFRTDTNYSGIAVKNEKAKAKPFGYARRALPSG